MVTYFEVIMDHAISDNNKVKPIIMKFLKLLYPIPGFLVVVVTVIYGGTPAEIWTFGDFTSVIPTFINAFALLLMSKKFFELLKDYKARYLSIGKIDPNFKLFYEDVVKEKKEKNNIRVIYRYKGLALKSQLFIYNILYVLFLNNSQLFL